MKMYFSQNHDNPHFSIPFKYDSSHIEKIQLKKQWMEFSWKGSLAQIVSSKIIDSF